MFEPGSSFGDSYPLSPEEKKNPMPSAAPTRKIWSNSAFSVEVSEGSPHESLTMLARWWSTM